MMISIKQVVSATEIQYQPERECLRLVVLFQYIINYFDNHPVDNSRVNQQTCIHA